jgi:hypothetical protein
MPEMMRGVLYCLSNERGRSSGLGMVSPKASGSSSWHLMERCGPSPRFVGERLALQHAVQMPSCWG